MNWFYIIQLTTQINLLILLNLDQLHLLFVQERSDLVMFVLDLEDNSSEGPVEAFMNICECFFDDF